MSRPPAFTERQARQAARDAGLIAQKLRPWGGFILIQPENNMMAARELTAAHSDEVGRGFRAKAVACTD
jgi:hypothetical protein